MHVSRTTHLHFRGRKCTTTQNVMCVVDVDLCFTYIYVGWEGSAHDARIFTMCVNDPRLKFFTPVGGIVSYPLMEKIKYCAHGLQFKISNWGFSIWYTLFVDAFYLVDSGYGLYRGFLTLYRRECYHL